VAKKDEEEKPEEDKKPEDEKHVDEKPEVTPDKKENNKGKSSK
jgi:hypothetical protein